MIDFHEGCDNRYCKRCLSAHEDLMNQIGAGITSMDVAGTYHLWLRQHGLLAETEGGWWDRPAFDEANIQAFRASLVPPQNQGGAVVICTKCTFDDGFPPPERGRLPMDMFCEILRQWRCAKCLDLEEAQDDDGYVNPTGEHYR